MDMGGGREKDKDPGAVPNSPCLSVRLSVCLCARACVRMRIHTDTSVCMWVFLRISTFASGSLRFSGKLLPPHKKEKPGRSHVC